MLTGSGTVDGALTGLRVGAARAPGYLGKEPHAACDSAQDLGISEGGYKWDTRGGGRMHVSLQVAAPTNQNSTQLNPGGM